MDGREYGFSVRAIYWYYVWPYVRVWSLIFYLNFQTIISKAKDFDDD